MSAGTQSHPCPLRFPRPGPHRCGWLAARSLAAAEVGGTKSRLLRAAVEDTTEGDRPDDQARMELPHMRLPVDGAAHRPVAAATFCRLTENAVLAEGPVSARVRALTPASSTGPRIRLVAGTPVRRQSLCQTP